MRTLFLVLVSLAIGITVVHAGTTGKITGKVTDKKTGEALPGVTIRLLENPRMGANTRQTGDYVILNVAAGDYTLKATAIGFETMVRTKVHVSADATITVNFVLAQKAVAGDTVVVVAERNPLIDPGRSVTKRQFTEEQIREIPRETMQGIISLSAGVTVDATNGGFSIRGGRSTETSVRVDNMEITDQQVGALGTNANFYPTVPTLGIEEVQVVSGGFAAEYGHALSGIINTVTRQGRQDRYEGELKWKWDMNGALNGISNSGSGLTPLKLAGRNEQLVQFGFGGPVPEVDGLRFYLSGQGDMVQHRGQYFAVNEVARLSLIDPAGNNIGQLPNDHLYIRELNGNITYDLSQDIKLNLNLFNGATFYELGRWSWVYTTNALAVPTPDQPNPLPEWQTQGGNVNQLNQQYSMKLTHTLSRTTVYELNFGFFQERTQLGKKNPGTSYSVFSWNGWNLYGFVDNVTGDNMGATLPNGQVNGPDGVVDRYYDTHHDSAGQSIRKQNAITGHYEGFIDGSGTQNAYGVQGAFYTTGDEAGLFEDQLHAYYQIDGNIQSQMDEHNLVKAGFETRFLHESRLYNATPWDPSGQTIDNFDYHPFDANLYVQDKAEYAGLVIQPGLRLDYFAPRAYHLVNPNDYQPYTPGSPFWTQSESKFQLSPRFGISYPISERTQFHISYGWFFQVPAYQALFSSLGVNVSSGLGSVIGNPDLGAMKTKSYEFGIAHQLADNLAFEVVAYYKDQYNILGTTQYSPISATGTNSVAYAINTTGEYANQRGIEVTFRKVLTDNWSLTGNLTFSQAMGTSSSVTQSRDLAQVTAADPYANNQSYTYYPTTEYAMDYDRSFVGNVILQFMWGKGQGPSISDVHFLENFNVNFTTVYQTGTPYTRTDSKTGAIVGDINGERYPSWWQTDARIERYIPLKEIFGDGVGNLEMSIYADINNVFNRTEALYVYTASGAPDNDGAVIRIGSFDPTPWYRNGTGPSQVDPYGRTYYTKQADANGDGVVDQQEKYLSYLRVRHDSFSRRVNYQLPREVWIGASLKF